MLADVLVGGQRRPDPGRLSSGLERAFGAPRVLPAAIAFPDPVHLRAPDLRRRGSPSGLRRFFLPAGWSPERAARLFLSAAIMSITAACLGAAPISMVFPCCLASISFFRRFSNSS